MANEDLYAICKNECGSLTTTLYKDKKYRYEYHGYTNVKVYNGMGQYVYFYEDTFKDFFYTEKELRKEKLKKLKIYER